MFGTSAEGVESNCAMIGLSKEGGLDEWSEIASIQAAWQAMRTFQQAEDRQKAESKLLGFITPMKSSEYANAKKAYERSEGKTEDDRLPGQTILDSMEADLEEGEYKAPRLNELPSRKEVLKANEGKTDASGFTMTWATSGVKVSQPVRVNIFMPSNSDEFRDRIRLLCAALEFMKIRHPLNRAWSTSSMAVWNDHIDYILGSKVRNREASDEHGNVKKTPSWTLVMSYELAVRQKAAELLNDDEELVNGSRYDLAAALKAARICQETRNDKILEQIQLQTNGASGSSGGGKGKGRNGIKDQLPDDDKGADDKKRKDKKRKKQDDRKGKGKGDGKPSKVPKFAENTTLHTKKDGKAICFAYNKGGCNRESCNMLHACQVCLTDGHPAKSCTSKKKKA
jgi:hypothetical protein